MEDIVILFLSFFGGLFIVFALLAFTFVSISVWFLVCWKTAIDVYTWIGRKLRYFRTEEIRKILLETMEEFEKNVDSK